MKRLVLGVANLASNVIVVLMFPLLVAAWIVRVHVLERDTFRLTRRARPRA